MKIQIDTKSKIIKLEGREKLSDLFDFLEKIFPNAEWEEYLIETNTVINQWQNPIIIDRIGRPPTSTYNPFWEVTCGTTANSLPDGATVSDTSGKVQLLNLEVN